MFPYDGKIQDFEAGEDLINNQIYIVDRKTQKIINPKDPMDWVYNETVLVLNPVSVFNNNDTYSFPINKGTICRCWRMWIQF